MGSIHPAWTSEMLRQYAALDEASRDMLAAARAGDWDEVCRLEGACVVVIARLRELGDPSLLPAPEQRERLRILRDIVLRDEEIRRLSGPAPSCIDSAAVMHMPASPLLH